MSAVTDIFGNRSLNEIASGGLSDILSAGYISAEKAEETAARYTKNAGIITQTRLMRDAYQSYGATNAGFAASGVMSTSGSALDVLRQSHRDAALDANIAQTQTDIEYSADLGKTAGYNDQAITAPISSLTSIASVAAAFYGG